MESIQIPDDVTVRVDMHEVQIHLIWEGYDIALPLTVCRLVAGNTQHLVQEVGGPPIRAPDQESSRSSLSFISPEAGTMVR